MSTHQWRDTWLLHRRQLVQLVLVALAFIVVWTATGWVLTNWLQGSAIENLDTRVSRNLAENRSERWNQLTAVGSMLADTTVKVVVTTIVATAMLIGWRRWREPLMVVVALVLEATCFIIVTTIVGRQRPDVARLESSPVDSSYPSGHVAAAVTYGAIIVVVFWHTSSRWLRTLSVAIVAAIAFAVAYSRVYRGMHYLSDVIMGSLLGAASVAATAFILRRAIEEDSSLDANGSVLSLGAGRADGEMADTGATTLP